MTEKVIGFLVSSFIPFPPFGWVLCLVAAISKKLLHLMITLHNGQGNMRNETEWIQQLSIAFPIIWSTYPQSIMECAPPSSSLEELENGPLFPPHTVKNWVWRHSKTVWSCSEGKGQLRLRFLILILLLGRSAIFVHPQYNYWAYCHKQFFVYYSCGTYSFLDPLQQMRGVGFLWLSELGH